MSERYTRVAEGIRCNAHGVVFAATSSCSACDQDPGPPLEPPPEPMPPPPLGCQSTLELERGLLATADEIARDLRKLRGRKVKDLRLWSVIAKLAEVRLKYLRPALELAARREDAVIQAERERRDREMHRGGGS